MLCASTGCILWNLDTKGYFTGFYNLTLIVRHFYNQLGKGGGEGAGWLVLWVINTIFNKISYHNDDGGKFWRKPHYIESDTDIEQVADKLSWSLSHKITCTSRYQVHLAIASWIQTHKLYYEYK